MSATRPAALWSKAFWRTVNPETTIVGFHRAEPDWVSPRRHFVQTDFDLWYVAAGRGRVQVDGVWQSFESGDLLALKPGSLYERECADPADPFQVYYAHLLPFGRGQAAWDAALARAWPFRISLRHRPEALRLFGRLFEAFVTGSGSQPLEIRGLTLQLLHVIFCELRNGRPVRARAAHLKVLQARGFIEKNHTADLRLGDIAAECALSPGHLSLLFSRQMHVAPIEYLIRVRVREAKLLLARGIPVKETAQRVGFHSQHYFCRAFRRRTGTTPTGFARTARRRDFRLA